MFRHDDSSGGAPGKSTRELLFEGYTPSPPSVTGSAPSSYSSSPHPRSHTRTPSRSSAARPESPPLSASHAAEYDAIRSRYARRDELTSGGYSTGRQGLGSGEDAGAGTDSLAARRAARRQERLRNMRAQGAEGDGDRYSSAGGTSEFVTAEEAAEIHQDLHEDNMTRLDDIMRDLHTSQATGSNTLASLERQGEQLDRIDKTVSSVNNTLTLSQRVLSGMKSFGGAIANVFSRSSTPKDSTFAASPAGSSTSASTFASTAAATSAASARKARAAAAPAPPAPLPPAPTGAINDRDSLMQQVAHDRAKEDQKLEDISAMLESLTAQSQLMNTHLVRQSAQISHIANEVDRADARMKDQSRQMDNMLR